jgi:hypothetical protein
LAAELGLSRAEVIEQGLLSLIEQNI